MKRVISSDRILPFNASPLARRCIDWRDWMRFHALGNPFAPLPRVTEGAHHFVVCIVEDGRLQNVIPHRYLIDRDGRIADDGNSVLSDVEIGR